MLLRFSDLNDFIEPGNPVRFINALVDKIELHQIDICHISTYKQKSTATDNGGAPSFDLKLMLKLYLYGYLNKIRSSRKLEQECKRNFELHWLIQKLILAQRIPRCRGQKQGKPCGKPQRIQAQASHRRTSLRHLKREWGYTYTLLKGLEKVDGEMNLNFLCYNIKRGLHILGIKNIQNALKNWQPDYAKAILRFILAQIRAKYSPNMTIKICNKIYTKKNIHPLLPFINQIPTFKNGSCGKPRFFHNLSRLSGKLPLLERLQQDTQTEDRTKMNIKHKLKYYIGIKEVLPEFLLSIFDRMSIRQKIIFYNTLKDSLTEEQKKVLLNELNLDLTLIVNSNKNVEEFRYILVGNIIDKHYYGENKEIKSGTKHFRAGAKVYLLPEYGGNGHKDIPVYGLPRKSHKKIHIVIRGSMIKNVRVNKTFDPQLIEKIDDNFFYDYFDNNETGLQGFADSMNEYQKNNSIEITDDADNNSRP